MCGGFHRKPGLVASVKEVLTVAAKDPDVKALVVRVNSPGGTVTASDILYHEIRAFKEKRKIPVVASIMDLGTSGGYYIASAADAIVAHPTSVTGSIGVIMLTMDASGLLEKIGVEANAVDYILITRSFSKRDRWLLRTVSHRGSARPPTIDR